MKGLVQRRQRIVRVRRVQHLQAAAAATQAEGRALKLETTSERLRELRAGMTVAEGSTYGGALSSVSELGMRLETVRDGMADAIAAARATAAEQAALRLAARIRQESAVRLEERSQTLWNAERERRLAAIAGRRMNPGAPS